MRKALKLSRRQFLQFSALTATSVTLAPCSDLEIPQRLETSTAGRYRIIFNRYPPPTFGSEATHVYSNDPVIQLSKLVESPRHARQLAALQSNNVRLNTNNPMFGDSLTWAHQIYSITYLSEVEDGNVPDNSLGDMPSQMVDITTRRQLMQSVGISEMPESDEARLCLFHLLVVLEWWPPSPLYLQQLQWSFKRASDFLYDVTDGYMAFGQVIFAGPEYMRSADIQIYASSRLFPRSWVSGMYDPKKYAPIRIGRGLWSKNRRMIIPWDAPEAFRILVHEFAHYGLGLKDGYLKPHTAMLASDFGRLHARKERLIDLEDLDRAKQTEIRQAVEQGDHQTVEWCRLTLPSIALATESIMSVLEGTSELVPHLEDHTQSKQAGTKNGKLSEWEELRQRFPTLKIPKDHSVEAGPGQLPLPLPEFGMIHDGSWSIDALNQANENPNT